MLCPEAEFPSEKEPCDPLNIDGIPITTIIMIKRPERHVNI